MFSPHRIKAHTCSRAYAFHFVLPFSVHKCVKFNRFGEVLIKNILTQYVHCIQCTHISEQSSNSLGYDFFLCYLSSSPLVVGPLARSLTLYIWLCWYKISWHFDVCVCASMPVTWNRVQSSIHLSSFQSLSIEGKHNNWHTNKENAVNCNEVSHNFFYEIYLYLKWRERMV